MLKKNQIVSIAIIYLQLLALFNHFELNVQNSSYSDWNYDESNTFFTTAVIQSNPFTERNFGKRLEKNSQDFSSKNFFLFNFIIHTSECEYKILKKTSELTIPKFLTYLESSDQKSPPTA